jgi:hypothetical protein
MALSMLCIFPEYSLIEMFPDKGIRGNVNWRLKNATGFEFLKSKSNSPQHAKAVRFWLLHAWLPWKEKLIFSLKLFQTSNFDQLCWLHLEMLAYYTRRGNMDFAVVNRAWTTFKPPAKHLIIHLFCAIGLICHCILIAGVLMSQPYMRKLPNGILRRNKLHCTGCPPKPAKPLK